MCSSNVITLYRVPPRLWHATHPLKHICMCARAHSYIAVIWCPFLSHVVSCNVASHRVASRRIACVNAGPRRHVGHALDRGRSGPSNPLHQYAVVCVCVCVCVRVCACTRSLLLSRFCMLRLWRLKGLSLHSWRGVMRRSPAQICELIMICDESTRACIQIYGIFMIHDSCSFF